MSAERRKEGRPDSPNKRRTCPPNAFTEAVKRGGPAGIDAALCANASTEGAKHGGPAGLDAAIHAVHESNPANLGFCSPDVKRTSTIIEFHRSTQVVSVRKRLHPRGVYGRLKPYFKRALGRVGGNFVVDGKGLGLTGGNGHRPTDGSFFNDEVGRLYKGFLLIGLVVLIASWGSAATVPKVVVSGARIRAFTTDLSAVGAAEIANKVGDPKIEHFVAPRAAGQFIDLTATVNPTAATAFARTAISWVGATQDPADGLKAKVSRAAAAKNTIQLNQGPRAVGKARAWVVWSDITAPVSIPIAFIDSSGPRPSAFLEGGFDFRHAITPASIITDADRPDLSGGNISPPPGGNHPLTGASLSGGANRKWDASRQVRAKILNPNGIPNAALSQPPAVNASYPSSVVIGNDDAGTGDEINNPYATAGLLSTCSSAFPISHNRGNLESCDAPGLGIAHDSGSAGNTWEARLHFREFSRLELNGTWNRISDDFPWRIHMKFKKFLAEVRTGPDGIAQTGATGDDVQVIPLGKGEPFSNCISPGPNGSLNSSKLGDDRIAGAFIDSGADGLCQSFASGDDVQLIQIGKGKPDTLAITGGANIVIDSALTGDDAGATKWGDDGTTKALDNAGF